MNGERRVIRTVCDRPVLWLEPDGGVTGFDLNDNPIELDAHDVRAIAEAANRG